MAWPNMFREPSGLFGIWEPFDKLHRLINSRREKNLRIAFSETPHPGSRSPFCFLAFAFPRTRQERSHFLLGSDSSSQGVTIQPQMFCSSRLNPGSTAPVPLPTQTPPRHQLEVLMKLPGVPSQEAVKHPGREPKAAGRKREGTLGSSWLLVG